MTITHLFTVPPLQNSALANRFFHCFTHKAFELTQIQACRKFALASSIHLSQSISYYYSSLFNQSSTQNTANKKSPSENWLSLTRNPQSAQQKACFFLLSSTPPSRGQSQKKNPKKTSLWGPLHGPSSEWEPFRDRTQLSPQLRTAPGKRHSKTELRRANEA